ncbi:ubiquinol-cytochrome c reductase iron-sulfur subunit [Streptomyces celluloflavus]|uniref:QcrA and Rieske domain-containing protein n=1 Tax=Streptomyces celluloflavus TaxID=58344 RepID=UPI0036DE49BF
MSTTQQPPAGNGNPERPEHGSDQPSEQPRDGLSAQDEAALRDRISADSLTTRRDYLRIVVTVSGGLAIGGLGVAGGVLHRHGDGGGEAKRIADRLPAGESLAFRYPGDEDRAVAIRLADGSLVGYSAICTHLACAVLWRKDRGEEGELYCPCHEGVFDPRSGDVTAGPPPRALPKVVLYERADGSIWAIGTARSGESIDQGLCRELKQNNPELASRVGCPGTGHSRPNATGDHSGSTENHAEAHTRTPAEARTRTPARTAAETRARSRTRTGAPTRVQAGAHSSTGAEADARPAADARGSERP